MQWTIRCASSALVLSLLSLAGADGAGNWPGWRGPTGMGITHVTDLPVTWGGAGKRNVLWKAPLPGSDGKEKADENQSSPVVWSDRVFVTASVWPASVAHREQEYPQHHVIAMRASDGQQLWNTVVPPGPWLLKDLRGGYTAPTPATDGQRLYVLFGSAVLAALDFDGKVLWRVEIVPYTFDVALGSSPLVYGDSVIVLCAMANKKDSCLRAFDKKTGHLNWEKRRPTMGFGHSTPALIEVQGKLQIVVNASGGVAAADAILGIDPATGKVIWWCRGAGDAATPAYGSGVLYCDSGRGGSGVAVDPTGKGDVSQTHVKWTVAQVPEGLSSAIIVDGYVYRLHEPGVLKCWKAQTGELVYAERLTGVSTWSSPIADSDRRIFFASAGKSYVIRGGPKCEILAVNDLGDDSRASPAAASGRLFLRGRRFLYCIGTKE